MKVIPDQISDSEPLSHALFHPGDAIKSPFWIKHKALVPPNKNPHEVSFNRASYITDSEQNKMAREVKRKGSHFRGFVVLNFEKLQRALELFRTQNAENKDTLLNFKVEFIYTPIYRKGVVMEWPPEIEKKWGNGYNPAHADLFYKMPVEPNEPNTYHTVFAKIVCKKENKCCEVYEVITEDENSFEP